MFGKKRGYKLGLPKQSKLFRTDLRRKISYELLVIFTKKCITLDGGEYITSATWMEVKFPA